MYISVCSVMFSNKKECSLPTHGNSKFYESQSATYLLIKQFHLLTMVFFVLIQ